MNVWVGFITLLGTILIGGGISYLVNMIFGPTGIIMTGVVLIILMVSWMIGDIKRKG